MQKWSAKSTQFGFNLGSKSKVHERVLWMVNTSFLNPNPKGIHTGPQQAGTGLSIQGPHPISTHTGSHHLLTSLLAPQKVDPRSSTKRVRFRPCTVNPGKLGEASEFLCAGEGLRDNVMGPRGHWKHGQSSLMRTGGGLVL